MTPRRRSRASCRVRAAGEQWQEVGAAEAGDVEAGTLQGRKQGLFGVAKEVEPAEVAAFDGAGLGKTVEGSETGREVVQSVEVAADASVQDLTQVGEAGNGLFDGSEGARCRALTMFYQSVVLESGDVVGGGLDAQDEPEFVVDLDPRCAKTMLDAGAFDAGG